MKWLDQYHWLVYSPSMPGGFCNFCVSQYQCRCPMGFKVGGRSEGVVDCGGEGMLHPYTYTSQ